MEIWQIIIIPVLTVILDFFTRPLEILLLRRRTGAINSIRVLSEFFYRYRSELVDLGHSEVVAEIDECLKYPNSLGSESQIAKLVGRVSALLDIDLQELKIVDLALNRLDQRATERDRVNGQI